MKKTLTYPAKVCGCGEGTMPKDECVVGMFEVHNVHTGKHEGSIVLGAGAPLCGTCLTGIHIGQPSYDIWFNKDSDDRWIKCTRCKNNSPYSFAGASITKADNQLKLGELE